jgi:hypothetical protein
MIRLRPALGVTRTARYLVLALGVHLAQQGALIHAVSHLHEFVRIGAPSTAAQVSNHDSPDAQEFCLECLAFAQVASAVPGYMPVAPDSDSLATAIATSGRLAESTFTVVFRARAPPPLV